MTLFGYRLGIRFFTLFGLLSLLVFLFGLDPGALSPWGMALFFLSLWVVGSGVFSLVLLFLYERAIGESSTAHFVGGALRQGILLGIFVLALALLLYFKVFAWWIALLLFAFLLLVEFTYRRVRMVS